MLFIIMPAYNAEKTIKYAIKSVQKQSFKDWNLIIINDGSNDDTLSICKEEANKDERIRVINQDNAGQFEARKNGLKLCDNISADDYVTFLDSDDAFYGSDNLESILKNENRDIICAGNICVFNNKNCKKIPLKKGRILEEKVYSDDNLSEVLVSFYGGSFIGDELCGKFFKVGIIKNAFESITVHPKRYAEDLIVNLYAFAAANCIALKSEIILCYAIGGLTSKFIPTFFDDFCIVDELRLKLICQYEYEEKFLRTADIQMYNVAISWLEMCYHSGKYDDEKLAEEITMVLNTSQISRLSQSTYVEDFEKINNRGYLFLFKQKDVENIILKVKSTEPANSIKSRIKRVFRIK